LLRLHKWYLDIATPEGDVLIAYAATLYLVGLRIGWSAVLGRVGGQGVDSSRFGRPVQPEIAPGVIGIELSRLGFRGHWRGVADGTERVLWTSPSGGVRWCCHLPRADAEVTWGGHTLRGVGYVEHLALDVDPWRLPLNELRWGRFHGRERSLVWIEWRGPEPLRLCLVDGKEREAEPIDDGGFTFDGGSVAFGSTDVIRDGTLGQTVLDRGIVRWVPLPASVRGIRETKWFGSATLVDGGTQVEGQVLHEVVRW
jgi:hypothetical protein